MTSSLSSLSEMMAKLKDSASTADLGKREEKEKEKEKEANLPQLSSPSQSSNISIATSPLTNLDQIRSKIQELQERLQAQLPGYESMLFYIHRYLAEDSEASFLLSEEEVGVIVRGLSTRKNVVIAKVNKASNKTTTGKSLKELSMDDI